MTTLDRQVVDSLFPDDLPEVEHWESLYPPRELPEGAAVTRFAPSPTGFVHIGGIYTAMIAQDVALRSGGRFFVRVEDTDKAREVADSAVQFARAFEYFGVHPDESDPDGAYGPYLQSSRERIYHSYVRQLLREGKAFLCFATTEQLAAITEEQRALKAQPGYYGRWAPWRDASQAEVEQQLAAGAPFVVRFRAPEFTGARSSFTDLIRGRIDQDDNRNNFVLLKRSDSSPWLPTYHLAHVVDDHLMRVSPVIRGEEWMSSVPVHHQLFDALGFDRIPYAHIAPLLKQEGSSKRKLSKRKDPEASVDFYIEAGYPRDAVLYYLRGLVNGRLAELPIADALAAPIRLDEAGVTGALVDTAKLDNIAKDVIGDLTADEVLDAVSGWATAFDRELAEVIAADREYARRVFDVERSGSENVRKDLARWSDARAAYGFLFPALFTPVTDPADERLGKIEPATAVAVARDFVESYRDDADRDVWFAQIRELAVRHGYAPGPAELKAEPERYKGPLRIVANVVRVLLTGASRSPDLWEVARVLGADEVRRRASALGA
ncbi:glutamyl-tRNA synthetase [Diaminobutyricimonas aerilata]|uniref:Glutamyl-tRNA synthetase n=1 Tax=Diaminobutyricimonas aerilata TaxID=1162967 RepID=A0A2M9CIY0_9MICO|nr:glutamate--tRNA ligase family protein [Diaminobutyricimonas aerilata]PJJ71873.1 glutamyl-tRNA synthetase [Diaminobutyricimonas aerilata]